MSTETTLTTSDKQITETNTAIALVKKGFKDLRTLHTDIKISARGKNPVLLLDVSTSMNGLVDDPQGGNYRSRYQHLCDAVKQFQQLRKVSFSSDVFPDELPTPRGWTALHKAIDFVCPYTNDSAILVSDGEPDDAEQAFSAARRFGRPINVIFIGDTGMPFMEALAKLTGGIVIAHDAKGQLQLSDFLKKNIAGMLGSGSADDISRGPIILP